MTVAAVRTQRTVRGRTLSGLTNGSYWHGGPVRQPGGLDSKRPAASAAEQVKHLGSYRRLPMSLLKCSTLLYSF